MAAAVNTRPPALTIGPPRVMVPVLLPGLQLPSGTSQTFAPEKRSTAATVPQGGALHGSPLGARSGVRNTPYGAPACRANSPWSRSESLAFLRASSNSARGISFTKMGRRLVSTKSRWLRGSYAALPQFTPPTLLGKTSVPCRLGGVKISPDPAALILSAHHCFSCASFPQASSGDNLSGTSEIVETGCVAQYSSPAMSLLGTGRSSTGRSGAPAIRLRTKTRPIFVEVTIAGEPSSQGNR